VPRRGLDLFAVGTDRFSVSLKEYGRARIGQARS
jgi:hypothetical protein